jgi:hypothetical protein
MPRALGVDRKLVVGVGDTKARDLMVLADEITSPMAQEAVEGMPSGAIPVEVAEVEDIRM